VFLHPVNLIPLLVIPLFVVLHHYGFIANSLWISCGSLVLACVTTMGFTAMFPPGSPLAKPVLHLVLEIAVIGVAIYAIGWGAVLAVGFVFAVSGHMNIDGSRLGLAGMVFTAFAVLIGELLIAAGVITSMLPEPQGHGLAALEVAGVCAVIWIMRYQSREKEAIDAELVQSEERLRALVEHASDAIVVMDRDTNVLYASPAVERLLGYPASEFTKFDDSFLPEDHVVDARQMFEHVLARPGAVDWIEVPLLVAGGDYRWFEIGITNRVDDPAVGGLVCNIRDVTERRSTQEELTFQAHHDALTRLPNRWLFTERLEQALVEARGDGSCVAVLFLDVDRFKLVNDSLGHEVGDRMLVTVAEQLSACLKRKDIVARFGGDEFTILLTGLSDPDVALRVADRIVEAMRYPLAIDGHDLFVSASVGVALSLGSHERAADLLQQADLAMYVAKEKGRGRWELFDPTLAPHVMERLEVEGDLRRALDKGELLVHFQPEVDLQTGDVVATEALLRWMHPRRGLLAPASFVPLAEESNLIVEIDRLVLREACRWARAWSMARPPHRPLVVSVNLSPRFMRQTDVVADITALLRESGVDPRSMQLEITERSALTDLETTCAQLHQLRALGVRVAIDDFGTGYSSLSYLKQLPVDVLKLDKSFVDGLDGSPADLAIVQAVVTMGHALGMKVTAEGVERPEQAAQLRELGCDSAMGWLWSRSVPPGQLGVMAGAGFMLDGGARDGVVVPLRALG
jgi:diguanylate cyclase (GGDEF)-like protein/PAS domain S-box-containing protein